MLYNRYMPISSVGGVGVGGVGVGVGVVSIIGS